MLAIKLLGAASGYILAWWVTQHEGAAAYGRFELALTVLAIGALGARLGLDGVMVKWLASAQVQGFAKIQRVVVARAVLMTTLAGFACCALVYWASNALTTWSGDENTRDMWPWVAVGRFVWFCVPLGCCGWLWVVLGCSKWLWVALGGSKWLWVGLGGLLARSLASWLALTLVG